MAEMTLQEKSRYFQRPAVSKTSNRPKAPKGYPWTVVQDFNPYAPEKKRGRRRAV